MTPIEYRMIRWIIVLATLTISTLTFLRWIVGTEVPEGDPDLVPAGIAVTLPPETTTTVEAPSSVIVTVPATTSTSTTSTLPPGNWQCPETIGTALVAGWPAEELEALDRIVWRESRCDRSVTNLEGRDRSYGWLQINVKGSLWADRQALCQLARPDDLLDGRTNLECGLRLFERSGWAPWGGRP